MGSRLTSLTIPTCPQNKRPMPRQELICAFWKGDNSSGYWSTTGCQKLGSRDGNTNCKCNHLSSFAILMAHYDVEVSSPRTTLKSPQMARLD